jgi:hypothetical protein
VQIDGHLGPRAWRDPKTGTMLWILAIAYLGPVILVPLAIAGFFAAIVSHAPRCKAPSPTYVGGVMVEGCR